MHKYEVIIYWSNEDDTFVAEVPELPGCSVPTATRRQPPCRASSKRSISGSIQRGSSAIPSRSPGVNA